MRKLLTDRKSFIHKEVLEITDVSKGNGVFLELATDSRLGVGMGGHSV